MRRFTGILICIFFSLIPAGCSDEKEDSAKPSPNDMFTIALPDGDTTAEDGTAITVSIALNSAPAADVSVTFTSSDITEGTISPGKMTFRAENYAKPQILTITGVDDDEKDGDITYTVSAASKSDDTNFSAEALFQLKITNKDNDKSSKPDEPEEKFKVIAPAVTVTSEKGSSIRGSIALSHAPAADVFITLSSSDTTEGSISPAEMPFYAENYDKPQTFTITGIDDNEKDGDITYTVSAASKSNDPDFNDKTAFQYAIRNMDDEVSSEPPDGTRIRFMTANITSGNGQSYDDGKGIRIMQAFRPDIVMIQEFNYTQGHRAFVDTTFGPDFHYHPGQGRIPNGIISRYPILESGTWDSGSTSDREWEWATIDIPGNRNLLAVSVHLSGKRHNKEFSPLLDKIKSKQSVNHDYVVLGGDFNARFGKDRDGLYQTLGSFFHVGAAGTDPQNRCIGGELPIDQNMSRCTSGERDDPYDWVLFDKEFDTLEIPITIGSHIYQNGHVIDSRVYAEHGDIDLIPPVKATDSNLCYDHPYCEGCPQENKTNMQHMAVIRDIVLPDLQKEK